MPVPKPLANIKRSGAALKRLNVSLKDLALAPPITALFKNADGGLRQVLTAMRFAPDEVIATFLEKYDSIPTGDLKCLSMEAVALAADVDINRLTGSIIYALQAQAANMVRIIAVTSQPKITRARVEYGQMPFGDRDRTALETMQGLLPSPKGPTFIGKAIFGTGKVAMDEQDSGGADEDAGLLVNGDQINLDRLFPPANVVQERLVPIRQKSRLLTEG